MKIALLGDMAFYGAYCVNTNNKLLDNLSEVSDYLAGFDCVVGNLETPFSEAKKTSGAKSAYICADVENVVVLKKLHLSAALLANNHMFDFGVEGYECTKRVLDKAGIPYYGTDGLEYLCEKDDNKIAFTGFCCYTSNPLQMAAKYGHHGVNCFNVDTVGKLMKQKADDGYLNIVAVHAGLEHVNFPHADHIQAARRLAEIVPYVYYGHHPHVIQGVEEVKDSLLAYSLGNFCFDDVYTSASTKPLVELTENNRTGMILELEVEQNKIVGWKKTIVHIGKDGHISVLSEVPAALCEYDAALASAVGNDEYAAHRMKIINDRMNERKAQRTLSWYLKRFRPRYVHIILNARKNAKAYNLNVKQYIK